MTSERRGLLYGIFESSKKLLEAFCHVMILFNKEVSMEHFITMNEHELMTSRWRAKINFSLGAHQ